MTAALDFYRLIIAVVMVGALAMVLSWLQGRYDQSDHEKAVYLVRTYRAHPRGPTITEVILARHPTAQDHQLAWSSEITSGCLGVVRVSGYLPKPIERTYAFDVRLTDPSIHPTDPQTIEILKALSDIKTTTTATIAPSPSH